MSKSSVKSDDYAWSTRIDHLMQWRPGRSPSSWANYCCNATDIWLIVHYGQLIIKSADKILESLSLNTKLKGYYKGNVLVLLLDEAIRDEVHKRRKIRFNFKESAMKYFEKLKVYFPVWGHGTGDKDVIQSKYCSLEDMIKKAMEATGTTDGNGSDGSGIILPSNFSDFIKVCLMDPVFPQYVNEVQNFILNMKKTQEE